MCFSSFVKIVDVYARVGSLFLIEEFRDASKLAFARNDESCFGKRRRAPFAK